jgi:hypothetical protein
MCRHKISLSVLVVIFLTVIIGGSMIVSSQNNQNRAEVSSTSDLRPKPDNLRVPPNKGNKEKGDVPQNIPDDVAYRQIFKHIEELNKKADKEEQNKGKDGQKFRNLYKQMARLDERKARILDKIADQTNRELKKLDDRAKQIIDQIRAQTPNHRIERGQKPPLPPEELFDLAKQRKDVTLKAISDLRTNFGEAEFVRFSQFVDEKVKSGIRKRGSGTLIQKGGQQK